MTIDEFIEFCNDNFDEKDRKRMNISHLLGSETIPIDLFTVKCGVNGIEIPVPEY